MAPSTQSLSSWPALLWPFSLRSARTGCWAALFGSCAAVTRIPGILVGLALAVLYWEKHRRLRASFLFLLLVPALPLGHIAMLRHNFGDPFPFLSGASAWREPRLLDAFGSFLQRDPFESSMYALQFGLFAAACGACVLALRRLGLAYGLWCSLHLLVSLKAPFLGMGRFTSVLFPLFVVGGQALSRGLFWSWTLLSAALLGLTTYGFSHWLPVM